MPGTLQIQDHNGIRTVALARPEVRNAFNGELIADLQAAFAAIERDEHVRVVILRGEGPTFCAGGDLNWLRESVQLPAAENLADTRRLARMFATMDTCSKPLLGLVHGAVIGGGVGLVSVCDYAICGRETIFSLSEVRLGIIPACIGPFVLAKIGPSHARAYFVSAERFTASRAYEIGLVHELVSGAEEMEAAGARIAANLLQCGPNAMAAAKRLIRDLRAKDHEEGLEYVARTLAELRVQPEGQEGMMAFVEKRKPAWSNQ